jgi:hypothetical protein
MVSLLFAQTLLLHAQEVFYLPKSYSLQVPPLPELPLLDANTTMLQAFVFNVEVMFQVFKIALHAHQTVSTAPYHQVLPHAHQLVAAVDTHSSQTDHVLPLVPMEQTDHQMDHVLLMERT